MRRIVAASGNSYKKAIKRALALPADLVDVVYEWYAAEDAFDDFEDVEEFEDYVRDDIYDMLDACDDEELKERIEEYL